MHPLADQLMSDGYLIVRNMIDQDELPPLRQAIEVTVDYHKALSARRRKPNEPEGGAWMINPQPRSGFMPDMEDPHIARAMEFVLGEKTLEFSRQLLDAPEALPSFFSIFQVICNAETLESGPAQWHRDLPPDTYPPTDGLQEDVRANGPYYLQWNIALHDDSILWVVPGSHARRSTPEETTHARDHPGQALPGAVCADLKAGDGVVYAHMLLHWGSYYSTKRRRTIHTGYRPYGGSTYRANNNYIPTAITTLDEMKLQPHLAPWVTEKIDRIRASWSAERDLVESALRAVMAGDGQAFDAALAALHPGPVGRMVTIVFLSKYVNQLCQADRGDKPDGRPSHPQALLLRFTDDELATLEKRFSVLDRKLRYDDGPRADPLAQGGPSEYRCFQMPEDFGPEQFVASWGGKGNEERATSSR